jgi:putative NADH-flavin reductase
MKILVLGGTGRTGRIFIKLAADAGHQVTAIIRNKEKADISGVNYIEGSPTDLKLVSEAIRGMDAAVVSVNINRTSDSPFAKIVSPLTIISDSVNTLIEAMKIQGVRRVVSVSASGVGDSWKDMPFIGRLFIRNTKIWKAYLDHDRQEKALRGSNLDWTIVRPVMLTDKDDASYKITDARATAPKISRKGVAKFILDSIEQEKYIRECVTVNA